MPSFFFLVISLQWGHGDEAVEEYPSGGVTGPYVFLLQWGHGDEVVEEPGKADAQDASLRFNGAAAMKPWKSSRRPRSGSHPTQLQWGHGDEAVEEAGTVPRHRAVLTASMGPRR